MLGSWITGSLFMMAFATQDFRLIDSSLEAPSAPASEMIQKLGKADARAFLRYEASEQNRWYFETWEDVQLVFGVLFLALVIFGDPRNHRGIVVPALMVALVVVMHFYLTPEIVRLGRSIDFLAIDQLSPERSRFWSYHMAYSAVDAVKVLLGLGLAVSLLVRHDKRSRPKARPLGAEAAGQLPSRYGVRGVRRNVPK